MIGGTPLTEHPVHAALQEAANACQTGLELEEITASQSETFERALAVCLAALHLIETTPAYLAPAKAPSAIEAPANTILRHCMAFANTRDPLELASLGTAGDLILRHLGRFRAVQSEAQIVALLEAASHYRDNLDSRSQDAMSQLESLRDGVVENQQKLDLLSAAMSDERARLSSLTADFLRQFADAQEQRNRSFSQAMEDRDATVRNALTDHAKLLSDQALDFQSAIREMNEQRTALLNGLKESYAQRADAIVGDVIEKREEVNRLLGVIGDDAVRSGYVNTADSFQNQTIFWQGLTIAAIASLIGLGCWQLVEMAKLTVVVPWYVLSAKAFVALTIGALAGYAATQAERASTSERKNRKLALELAAMGPFLAKLPQGDQDKFKLSIGDRYFGRFESEGEVEHSATIVSKLGKDRELRRLLLDLAKILRGA